MADRLFLSNDASTGYAYDEEEFLWFTPQESSVHGFSTAAPAGVGIAKRNGKIVDFFIGVTTPATSASGFVSGTVDATLGVNSALVCSTNPAIAMAGSAGQAVRKATNAGGGTSAVVNAASAVFSKGDQIQVIVNARSVGSAAAGAAGSGVAVGVVVRYAAD